MIWRSRSSQPPSQSPSKTRPRCIATVTGLFSFGFSCFSIGKFVLDCRLRVPRALCLRFCLFGFRGCSPRLFLCSP